MDITILKKLGLSDKEIKVYLALLENSTLSVRAIAELTDINRGTVYDILKSLQEMGLAAYYHADTKQKFVAEDPEKLIELVRSREAEIKTVESSLKSLVPELKSIQDKGKDKPATKFYEGARGVRSILEDLLKTMAKAENKEYYVYSAKNASEDLNKAFPDFTKKRIKAGIHVKVLSLAKGGGLSGLDERKWLGTDDKSATFILLYDGKCAYVDSDAIGKPIGVIIENKSIFQTNKLIFQQIWKIIK